MWCQMSSLTTALLLCLVLSSLGSSIGSTCSPSGPRVDCGAQLTKLGSLPAAHLGSALYVAPSKFVYLNKGWNFRTVIYF